MHTVCVGVWGGVRACACVVVYVCVCVCVRYVELLEDGDENREPGEKRT